MSVLLAVPGAAPAASSARTVDLDEYHHMIATGILDEDQHLELLHGRVVTMSPPGIRHARAVEQLSWLLVRRLDDRYRVRVQLPLILPGNSEPEPDIAIVLAEPHRRDHHPTTARAVIEVAEHSLDRDRDGKAPLYALAEIPEYWIVNLLTDVVEIHRTPIAGLYTRCHHVGRGELATFLKPLPSRLAVADILA